MGTKIKTQTVLRRRRRIHDEWTDGGVWELVQGEDFQCSVETFRSDLHNRAQTESRRRNSLVRLETTTRNLPAGTIHAQFVDTKEPLPEHLRANRPRLRPAERQEQAPTGLAALDVCNGDGYAHVRGQSTGGRCPECGLPPSEPEEATVGGERGGEPVDALDVVLDPLSIGFEVPDRPHTDEEFAALPILDLSGLRQEGEPGGPFERAEVIHVEGLHTGAAFDRFEPVHDPASEAEAELVVRARP